MTSELKKLVLPTTIITSCRLNDELDADVTIITETFQHTGSFKFRAAMNVVLNISNSRTIAASSGNFGQALAYACKLTKKGCTIVMPSTSSQVKLDAIREYGAAVDLIDTSQISRSERVSQLSMMDPEAYVASAFDDELVIAGNATLWDEIEMLEHKFDVLIAPVGGGGLMSGLILGRNAAGSSTAVWGAEPLLANDAARSLKAGGLLANQNEPQTIADGARTVSLGIRNWPILRDGLAGIMEVTEAEIREGVKLLFHAANLKSEPTGALGIGALFANSKQFAQKSIAVVVSGGNVDTVLYSDIICNR